MKTLYSAKVTATGGRDGKIESSDGRLSAALSMPKELGGPGAAGATNPEQLFAGGYAACFESAIRHTARGQKVTIPGLSVEAEVGLSAAPVGFKLNVVLRPRFEGMEQAACEGLVREAHKICPYSNATRGNIDVDIYVNGSEAKL